MRKKNLLKKGVILLMTGVLMVSSLTGCKGKDEAKTNGTSKEAALSYGMVISSAWKDRYEKFTDLPVGIELQNQTGTKLDMVHVEDNTAMNLLLAGGDFPDIIGFNWQLAYTGGEAKAIEDGVIYGMSEEFVKENAPDYWKVLSENPDLLKQVKTPSGDIYGFAFILGDELLKGGYGLIIRDDWSEELGIKAPETAEDFYQLLKGMKEKKGVEIPLSIDNVTLGALLDRGIITSPFELVTRDIYVDNNTVTVGYAQDEYKEVLTWLHKLYAEGLLDPNFATIDQQTVTSNMLTGKAGVSAGACGSILGTWLSTNSGVENYSLAGIKNLVANAGDTPMFGHYNTDVTGGVSVISTESKDKEAAAKYLNYGYTEAGHNLYNFGIEGKSYEMKDGKPVFTDLIMKNPDGLTVQQALSEYELAYGNGPFVQDKDYLLQYYSTDEQKDALVKWSENDAKKYKLPRITINDQDVGEYSSLSSDINTYRDEMTIKFIIGSESLDNYDKYLKTLESMGIERLTEIVQNAVDEYNSR